MVRRKLKLLTGLGLAALAGGWQAEASSPTTPEPGRPWLMAEAGEGGGEAGSTAADQQIYSLNSTDPKAYHYEAGAVIAGYADLVEAAYRKNLAGTEALAEAVDKLLGAPSADSLKAARQAWIEARKAYMRTEAFRFYGGPIDGIESRLNAWPVNEAYIDAVQGAPQSGIINDSKSLIEAHALLALNQKQDEADVTVGWHALEFLLWGQDLSADGPGNRPFSDFVAGTPATDARRAYTALLARLLSASSADLVKAWEPGYDNYRKRLLNLPPREAVGRILNGLAILTGYELMSERLTVALDSGDQEDEQSCFSDTTKQDFIEDLAGVRAIWTGEGDGVRRPGLGTLVIGLDPDLAKQVDASLQKAIAAAIDLGDPWDQVLAKSKESPERVAAEDFANSLETLTSRFVDTGKLLGVLVLVPSE